jgi:RimJ/RimL family protein N-acetyltransferase
MKHSDINHLEGSSLVLRLIRPDDAEYVYALRSDPRYNTHLSVVTGTTEDQRSWIKAYKARESEGTEYYYIIKRLSNGLPCGLVRLYDIEGDQFTWGSWVLDENKPSKAALESAVLIYTIAFKILGLKNAVFDVRGDNVRTIAFHKRFGATQTHSDEQNSYFNYSRDRFEADYEAHMSILQPEALR